MSHSIKRVIDYAFKREICVSPLYLRLGITNDCNLKCVMCPNKFQNDKKGYMEFSTFKKAVDDTLDIVKHVGFSYSGEALLHPNIVDFVKYINKANPNVIVGIVTNATLLKPELSYRLIKAGLKSITFSVDSFKKEVYKKIRIGASLEEVLDNIEEFIEIRNQLNKQIHTTISMISHFNENQHLIPDFIDKNVKIIKIPLHNYGGNINIKAKEKKFYFPCRFPWSSVVVSWNGNVLPCCIDHYQKEIVGNVNNENTLSIWNSYKMKKIRKNLATKNLPDLCTNCDMLYSTTKKDIFNKIKSVYKV